MINLQRSTIIQIIQLIIIVFLTYMHLARNSRDSQMPKQQKLSLKMDKNNDTEKCIPTQDKDKRELIDEFKQIGDKYGTDKTEAHDYHNMYGTVLGPMKNKRLSLLEIGLGCTMPYGPGRSIPVWREFLPKVKVSILEYDGNCAEKFRSKVEQLFIGDQSDFKTLKEVAKGGPYDVIVDDGGHQVMQQINSLIGLWPALNSGGVYFIEDLHLYSYKEFYNPEMSTYDWIQKLNLLLISSVPFWDKNIYLTDNVKIPKEVRRIYKTLFSIECYHRACVLVKK